MILAHIRRDFCIVLFLLATELYAQISTNTPVDDIKDYARNIIDFNREYPQEKVYLHMDNRCYYIGDTIWFKAYVMNATTLRPTLMSGVLYVELLNEKGIEMEHKKMRLENGMCHGHFVLKEEYRTGYYEIRSYTRYMLNWGNEKRTWTTAQESVSGKYHSEEIEEQSLIADGNHCLFSRVFPVYMIPEKRGIYVSEMEWYPPHPLLAMPEEVDDELIEDSLRLSFFPEGGELVAGLPSTIAFEVTDQMGGKREISGWIMEDRKKEVVRFYTTGRGRGTFSLCPHPQKTYTAHVEYKGKQYRYKLPTVKDEGGTLHLTPPIGNGDASFNITVSDGFRHQLLGWTLQCRGQVTAFDTITLDSHVQYDIDIFKDELKMGVNQLTLFTSQGEVLADRLFFVPPTMRKVELNIPNMPDTVAPFEEIALDLHLKIPNSMFSQGHFSLSVTDAKERGEATYDTRDICSELLLTSELKGFIEDVDSYFRHTNDTAMAADIDLLMMVQGWRRYEWTEMSAYDKFTPVYRPEKGLEIDGYVATDNATQENFLRAEKYKRIPNVKVSIDLHSDFVRHKDVCIADSLGRFHFTINKHFPDEVSMIIRLSENDSVSKAKLSSNIKYSYPIIQRAFSPATELYSYYQIHSPEEHQLLRLEDSVSWSMGKMLDDVEVSKRRKAKSEIHFENPDIVIDYFKEWNNIMDRGIPLANYYEEEFRCNFDRPIDTENPTNEVRLYYSLGRTKLWGRNVVDNKILDDGRVTSLRYHMPKQIKVYSNLLTRGNSPQKMDRETDHRRFYHLVIERFPSKKSPTRAPYMLKNGTRITYYEGYSRVREFYSPDYSERVLPDTADYRRTLYWNPNIWTDTKGRASVTFYNNKNTKKLHVRAEGFTRNGDFIVYDSSKE